jgi:hypothetical protein
MRALLRAQAGVIAVRQGLEHGWSYATVRHAVASGRWQRVHHGVLLAQTGSMTYFQQTWAALLACGDESAASHATALWLVDRAQPAPKAVHVTVAGHRVVDLRDRHVQVHRSLRLDASVHPTATPRRMTVEGAVLDELRTAASLDDAVAAMARTVQRGLTTASRLLPHLDAANNLPRRAALLDALALAGSGAHSAAEVRYGIHARQHGLPHAICQRREVVGGAVYLDVLGARAGQGA